MPEIATLERVLWGLSFFLNVGLVLLLLYWKNHRVYPLFFVYAASAVFQSIALFGAYRAWGFNSPASLSVGWGTQLLVTSARALAVAEICHRIMAKYEGIWKVARLLLISAAAFVALFSWSLSQSNLRSVLLSFDRGMALAIASVIVILLLLSRYYAVSLEPTVRTVATGFFLYSSFCVLNNTVAERWLTHSTMLWNVLGTVTFIASLLLWAWAFREPQEQAAARPEMLPESVYGSLVPEIDSRLKTLNEQLNHFWGAEGKKT